MGDFRELKTTRKGAIGERIIFNYLVDHGWIVYEPVVDGAHPFDKLCATPDKRELMIAEVKTKPARNHYPDTGFNMSVYDDYMKIQMKYGMDIQLFFVDEMKRKVYGNTLTKLIERRQVPKDGGLIINGQQAMQDYPWKEGNIIYFPLVAMIEYADISDEDCSQIKALNTRNGSYKY